jgi:transposase InsO family protein
VEYPVKIMCRVLEVSTSGYYQWRKDARSQREADDERLIDLIKVLHADSYGSYGVRRIVKGLKQQGILVNLKRIRRLMRQIGLKGKGLPRRFVNTTDSNHDNPVSENHLDRCFTVEVPNTKWVSDITYIWTEEGWLYLAVVIDLFNRMVVGWATSSVIDSELVCMALQRAISRRNPPPGLLLHSDRGVQYTSEKYRQLVQTNHIQQSMSRLGNCWDNAVAESFFRSLKVEAIYGYKLKSKIEAENRIFDYIERFYNTRRVHSFLLYKSPVQFELDVLLNPNLLSLRQKFLK